MAGLDRLLIRAVSQEPDRRNADAEQQQHTRLSVIDSRIAEIDTTVAKGFPDYSALVNLEALSISDVRRCLATMRRSPYSSTRPIGNQYPRKLFFG